jgi:dTDP-4-dehydrorhamnose reductase
MDGKSVRPVLLFGGSGQVGQQLVGALAPLGTIVAPSRTDADLTSPSTLREIIARVRPAVIVNAAGLTNVDLAEREPALADAVNGVAPGVMASAARGVSALFVHYSTDYVFDGAQRTPYDEQSRPAPVNVYGRSKLSGEQRVADADVPHFVIRTSWVYSATGSGFVASLIRDLPTKQTLRIVADQVGSPTWSRSLAFATAAMIQGALNRGEVALPSQDWGIYHLAGSGEGSRVQIVETLLDSLAGDAQQRRPTIIPVSAADFGASAPRPHYSALSNGRAARRFGVRLDPWRAELRRMVSELRR